MVELEMPAEENYPRLSDLVRLTTKVDPLVTPLYYE